MGDPKRIRKKYQTPKHPWIASRIAEEKVLKREYGLSNKKEIWKMESTLKRFKDQAKKLVALNTEQAKKEEEQLFNKMIRLGLLKSGSTLDDILGLSIRDILNRRLQTILVKKNLARSMKQARQLIVHQHIMVGGRKITSPSYLVKIEEEATVSFSPDSPLFREDHPERFSEAELEAKRQKEAAKKEKKEKEEKKEEDALVIDEKELEAAEEATGEKKAKKEDKKSEDKTNEDKKSEGEKKEEQKKEKAEEKINQTEKKEEEKENSEEAKE